MLARSEDTIVVQGHHYFPWESVNEEYLRPSERTSTCIWKGKASYLDVVVGDDVNPAAAWYYPEPSRLASRIRGHVAFWQGVEVSD